MAQTRVQQALSLLKPFDQLDYHEQRRINHLKSQFPYDDQLTTHLEHLHLLKLLPYLVWVPYENFRDVQQLAKSGFANVWKGTIRSFMNVGGKMNNEVFALKEIDDSVLQEVVLNAVVAVHNYMNFISMFGLSKHEETGKYLMVMEYAELGSLEQQLCSTTEVGSWHHIYKMAYSICYDLAQLHSVGLVHNNLHPGNIVFKNHKYDSRIIDIGLAKVIGDHLAESTTEQEGFYGRLAYLPPECFNGEPYTSASDIYCLGTIMWQLVSHVPPRGTAGEIFRADRRREDPVPGTPPEFQNVIDSCWKLNPINRPSAEKVLKYLFKLKKDIEAHESTSRFSLNYFRRNRVRPTRATKVHVANLVANHRKDIVTNVTKDFGICSTSTDLSEVASQESSFRVSQYYGARQLARFSRYSAFSDFEKE